MSVGWTIGGKPVEWLRMAQAVEPLHASFNVDVDRYTERGVNAGWCREMHDIDSRHQPVLRCTTHTTHTYTRTPDS